MVAPTLPVCGSQYSGIKCKRRECQMALANDKRSMILRGPRKTTVPLTGDSSLLVPRALLLVKASNPSPPVRIYAALYRELGELGHLTADMRANPGSPTGADALPGNCSAHSAPPPEHPGQYPPTPTCHGRGSRLNIAGGWARQACILIPCRPLGARSTASLSLKENMKGYLWQIT